MRIVFIIATLLMTTACLEEDLVDHPIKGLDDPTSIDGLKSELGPSGPEGPRGEESPQSDDRDGVLEIVETGYAEQPPTECQPEDCGPLALPQCQHPGAEENGDPVCELNEDGVCEWSDYQCPDVQDENVGGVPECSPEDCGPRPEVLCDEGVAEVSCAPNLDLYCEWVVGVCR